MLERIKAVIAAQLGIDAADIAEDSELVRDLKADSLDIVQFVIEIENEIGVSFEDAELAKLRTVGDIVRFLGDFQK